MNEETKAYVRWRAGQRCEYCGIRQAYQPDLLFQFKPSNMAAPTNGRIWRWPAISAIIAKDRTWQALILTWVR